jgi:hypothetical protein
MTYVHARECDQSYTASAYIMSFVNVSLLIDTLPQVASLNITLTTITDKYTVAAATEVRHAVKIEELQETITTLTIEVRASNSLCWWALRCLFDLTVSHSLRSSQVRSQAKFSECSAEGSAEYSPECSA